MRYHDITKDDMKNGDGLRVVLWVAGCSHHCKECQNPITWDPDGGLLFDEEASDGILIGKSEGTLCVEVKADKSYLGNFADVKITEYTNVLKGILM